jgi:hypothetical protein
MPLEQADVRSDLMGGRHRVEYEIEALGRRGHGGRIAGYQEAVRSGGQRGRLLGGRRGNGHHGVAHGLGQPQAHLAEAADADDADAEAAIRRLPVVERRIHGDAGAEDRPGRL